MLYFQYCNDSFILLKLSPSLFYTKGKRKSSQSIHKNLIIHLREWRLLQVVFELKAHEHHSSKYFLCHKERDPKIEIMFDWHRPEVSRKKGKSFHFQGQIPEGGRLLIFVRSKLCISSQFRKHVT